MAAIYTAGICRAAGDSAPLQMDIAGAAGNSRLYIPAAPINRRICRGSSYYQPSLLCYL